MKRRTDLRALIIEDSQDDTLMLIRMLDKGGFDVDHLRIDTRQGLCDALEKKEWDVVLCDYTMPGFNGVEALRILRGMNLDMPFIFVSGTIGEDHAIAAMGEGAQDYIMKDNLKRLIPVVERELLEAQVRREKHLNEVQFRNILQMAPDAIITADEQQRIFLFNRGAEQVFGYRAEEVLGQSINILFPERFALSKNNELGQSDHTMVSERKDLLKDVQGRRRDGSEFPAEINVSWVEISGQRSITVVLRDITERRDMEQQLDRMAYHDDLTGLPNRRHFRTRLEQALPLSRRNSQLLAVFLLDIDRFKNINDSLGHSVGDELIQQVAQRLSQSLRLTDTVARLGGDEFAILMLEIDNPEIVPILGNKILEVFKEPFTVSGTLLHTDASVGIAIYPNDGDDYESLVRNADIAMFRAKEKGGGNWQFYRKGMMEKAFDRLLLDRDLRKAIENKELSLQYQPQINTSSGAMESVEALARWTHPKRGMVPPSLFVPLAEDTGLIISIGEWIFKTACLRAVACQKFNRPLKVAINVSARQFREDGLLEMIANVLQETGAKPEWLELEITESVLMQSHSSAIRILEQLRDMGFTVALDDFGVGYSSLGYLKKFPVDTLKIDRSFISEIDGDKQGGGIVRAIIAMAEQMGIRVVAEGVETQQQHDFLREAGCHLMQGYFHHRPMGESELERLLS